MTWKFGSEPLDKYGIFTKIVNNRCICYISRCEWYYVCTFCGTSTKAMSMWWITYIQVYKMLDCICAVGVIFKRLFPPIWKSDKFIWLVGALCNLYCVDGYFNIGQLNPECADLVLSMSSPEQPSNIQHRPVRHRPHTRKTPEGSKWCWRIVHRTSCTCRQWESLVMDDYHITMLNKLFNYWVCWQDEKCRLQSIYRMHDKCLDAYYKWRDRFWPANCPA